MNAEKQSFMTELYNDTFRDIKEGEIVKGTVAAVHEKEVVVDIGFKSEVEVVFEPLWQPSEEIREMIGI